MGAKKVKNPPLVCVFVCVSVTYEKNKIPYFMQKVYIFIFYTQQCAVKYIFFILQKKYRGVVCV